MYPTNEALTLRIFISYSRKDIELVAVLQERLRQLGTHPERDVKLTDVWWDKVSIAGGEEWLRQLEEGLDNANLVVFFMSQNSLNSRYVKKEFDRAQERNIQIYSLLCGTVERDLLTSASAQDFYERARKIQFLDLTGMAPPFAEHPNLPVLDKEIERIWCNHMERFRNSLPDFSAEKEQIINQLVPTYHPWAIDYFIFRVKTLLSTKVPNDIEAQYYVEALTKIPTHRAKAALRSLQQWWTANGKGGYLLDRLLRNK